MTTLATSLGQAGPGLTKTIGGKSWTLIRSTKNIQADWGKWYAERVEAAVMDTAAAYRKKARALRRDIEKWQDEQIGDPQPADERVLELDALIDDAAKEAAFLEFEARAIIERFGDRKGAGEFEYHGNAALQHAMQNLPGQFHLAYLCLKPKHPTVTLDEVVQAFAGNAQEWAAFLIESEGAGKKKEVTNSTPTDTEPTPASQ